MVGRYRDSLIMQLPKTSCTSKSPCLLNLPPTIWSGLPLSLISPCPPHMEDWFQILPGSTWRDCEPTTSEPDGRLEKWPWERGICGENPILAINFCVRRSVQHMLDACGLPREYGNAPQTSLALRYLFEKLCIAAQTRNKWLP